MEWGTSRGSAIGCIRRFSTEMLDLADSLEGARVFYDDRNQVIVTLS